MGQETFAIREGQFEHGPAIMMVNQSLQGFVNRLDFPWHLSLEIDMEDCYPNGLPKPNEALVLNEIEDQVLHFLDGMTEHKFIGRISYNRIRTCDWFVKSAKDADSSLKQVIAKNPKRELAYRIAKDLDWTASQIYFD